MKKLVVFFIFLSSCCFGVKNNITSIPSNLYVNNGKTNFSQIFKQSYELQKKIEELFNKDRLDHELTKAFDLNAIFSYYWSKNKLFWYECDLNKDGINELLYIDYSKDKKPVDCKTEIYYKSKKGYKLIYKETGVFTSFKIHSNTKEIILFHHRFPCCSSQSNNIDLLRLVQDKIKLRRKYFIASVKKNLTYTFPNSVNYTSNFCILQKEQLIYWERSKTAGICLFPKNSVYKLLAKKNGWKYVEMFDFPVKSSEISPLINIDNFQDVHMYGWIK